MKKKFTVITVVLTIFVGSVCYSQDEITRFFKFGEYNTSKLVEFYLEPLGHSMGNNLNSGWYNTGRAHGLGRFDLRFGMPVTFVSDEHLEFMIRPDDFEGLSLVDVKDNFAPTLFGSKDDGPDVRYEGEIYKLPSGTGKEYFSLVPLFLQLNLGLVRDTEIMFRFMPTVSVRGFSTGLYGFGIKHGIKQHIPFMKQMPPDLSLIGSYARMISAYGLEYNPLDNPDIDVDKQELDITSNAYSVSLVLSQRFPFVSVYGGVRYMYSDTRFAVSGQYDIGAQVLEDPVDVEVKNSQLGLNGGMRLKLGFICLFADGTWANYSSITAGISIGFHN